MVGGEDLCSVCSPLPSPSISIPSSLSSGVVRPINHRASAYHLGAPIACQSSDKMDFQLSQGSRAGPGRMENRQTLAAAPLLCLGRLSVCYLFFSFDLLPHSASVPLPLLATLPLTLLITGLPAGATQNENPNESPDTITLLPRRSSV